MNWIKKHKIPLLVGVGLIALYELYKYFANSSASSSASGYDPTTDPYYQALEQLAATTPAALAGGAGGSSSLGASSGDSGAGALTTPALATSTGGGATAAAPVTTPTGSPYDISSAPSTVSETSPVAAGSGSYSPASSPSSPVTSAGDLTAFQTECAQKGGTIAADGSCYQGQFAGFADPNNPAYNPGFVAGTITDYCALQASGDPAIAAPDPACSGNGAFNIGVTAAPTATTTAPPAPNSPLGAGATTVQGSEATAAAGLAAPSSSLISRIGQSLSSVFRPRGGQGPSGGGVPSGGSAGSVPTSNGGAGSCSPGWHWDATINACLQNTNTVPLPGNPSTTPASNGGGGLGPVGGAGGRR